MTVMMMMMMMMMTTTTTSMTVLKLYFFVHPDTSDVYIRETGLTVESNSSTDLTKALKIIYSQQKVSRLYYEMLTQGKDCLLYTSDAADER